jgi:peptidoglycan/LPS O-acetylase OafA/YrhL
VVVEVLSRIAAAFSPRDALRRLVTPQPDAVPVVTGLRALSVLWVLLQHTQQGLRPLGATPAGALFLAHPLLRLGWAGNLGVDVFFVISGYLIGGLLMREREETGRIAFGLFYARRALRILPAYLAAIVLYVALGAPHAQNAWANVLFVNNFLPFTEQFMAHTWSLAIEEQFYAVFPIALLGLYLVSPRRRTALLLATVAGFAALAVALVFVCDLEVSLVRPNLTQFWRYMDVFFVKPYARFGSMFVGVVVVHLERTTDARRALERHPRVASACALAGLCAMAFIAFVFPETRGPNGERLVLGSLGLALNNYLFAGAVGYLLLLSRTRTGAGRVLQTLLGARVWHPFAQLSYAAYLYHPACITPLLPRLGFDLTTPLVSFARTLVASVTVSFAAALLVHLVVELPLLKLRPKARVAPA